MWRWAAVFVVACAVAAHAARLHLKESHAVVRRVADDLEHDDNDYPLCPSPDSDEDMECPKRFGICCGSRGRPTGRCCAHGESCTSDDPPQCVAFAGLPHLDRLIEHMDTGLHHLNNLDEIGDSPTPVHPEDDDDDDDDDRVVKPKKTDADEKLNMRDAKLELLRMELESLKGEEGRYLTADEFHNVEKELKTLEPPELRAQEDDSKQKSKLRDFTEDEERANEKELMEDAQRKAKEKEQAAKQKQAPETAAELEAEQENQTKVEEEEAEARKKQAEQRRKDALIKKRVAQARARKEAQRKAQAEEEERDREEAEEKEAQQKRQHEIARLTALITKLEAPLKLQIDPDPAAIHSLNYLKARLHEVSEGRPSAAHRANARKFLNVLSTHLNSHPAAVPRNGCNDSDMDCKITAIADEVANMNPDTCASSSGCHTLS